MQVAVCGLMNEQVQVGYGKADENGPYREKQDLDAEYASLRERDKQRIDAYDYDPCFRIRSYENGDATGFQQFEHFFEIRDRRGQVLDHVRAMNEVEASSRWRLEVLDFDSVCFEAPLTAYRYRAWGHETDDTCGRSLLPG